MSDFLLVFFLASLTVIAFSILNGFIAKAKGQPAGLMIVLSIIGLGLFVYLYLLAVPPEKT